MRPGAFEHAWQVAQTAVELHDGLPDWEVVSERMIRSIEDYSGDLFASTQIGHTAEQAALHRPDLAIVSCDATILASIEVELSIKSAARLAAICRGWARAPHVDRVYYLAATGPGRAVKRAVESERATNRIRVLDLDQAHLLATEVDEEEREREAAREVGMGEEAPAPTSTPGPHRESRIMADMRALQEQYR